MALTLPTTQAPTLESHALRLDFRSDTVTQPTHEMLEAMASAPLGDDVQGEDPTVNSLEAEAARIFGKQAGLEVIAEASAHVANSEVGGAARLGGLTVRPVVGRLGKLQPEQVARMVRPENVHYAHTTLLAIENTHNASGGTVLQADEMAPLVTV